MGQRSESMVGGIVLNPVETERSFSLDFLFTNLPQYAKKKRHTVYLSTEGFCGIRSWSGE